MNVHLHLAEFQVAVGHQGEDRSHRFHPLLHHVRRAHGLFQRAVPTGAIHLPAEIRVLVAVVVIRLEREAFAVLSDALGQIDGLLVVGGPGGGYQARPGHVIANGLALHGGELDGHGLVG